MDLGPETGFSHLPASIRIGSQSYYLVRDGAEYRLLSRICPHQGGTVIDAGDCFECPQHGWQFDHRSGQCRSAPNQRLASFSVTVREGRLIGEMLLPAPSRRPPGQGLEALEALEALTIRLHAHACLEIVDQEFSLLTDPWLCGPAFLGAWIPYPPPLIDVSRLQPDAILISHEHSDHFHEPTLARFDRSTPIYVPDFPNRRLVEALAALGFDRVCPMAFGRPYAISDRIKITCFEPGSLWNDAIVLIEIDRFRLLNLNDAGLNSRIAASVGPVHAVASSFSPGASGYPLTWTHLTAAEKTAILERACQGTLRMLQEAMELYGGRYLLPFASHFTLWHPAHRKYVCSLKRNRLDDVMRTFEGSPVQVIDLLPGEAWSVPDGQITRRWHARQRLYDPTSLMRHLERRFDPDQFAAAHPISGTLTRAEVESYFLRLNQTPEIAFCEDLQVRVQATEQEQVRPDLDVSLEFRAGRVQILSEPVEAPNVAIEIPLGILRRIVRENLSWDEALIGYWCRLSRSPDVYHAGFWRLLQAPYFQKPAPPPLPSTGQQVWGPVTGDSVIAELLEKYGDPAERILRRSGLYCAGCFRSTFDSLALAGRHHGIDEARIERLVRELNEVFQPTRENGARLPVASP